MEINEKIPITSYMYKFGNSVLPTRLRIGCIAICWVLGQARDA